MNGKMMRSDGKSVLWVGQKVKWAVKEELDEGTGLQEIKDRNVACGKKSVGARESTFAIKTKRARRKRVPGKVMKR